MWRDRDVFGVVDSLLVGSFFPVKGFTTSYLKVVCTSCPQFWPKIFLSKNEKCVNIDTHLFGECCLQFYEKDRMMSVKVDQERVKILKINHVKLYTVK